MSAAATAIICSMCEAEGSTYYRGRTWRWEYHSYCGPTFVDKDGNSVKCPPEKSPVWFAFNLWLYEYFKKRKDMRGMRAMEEWMDLETGRYKR